MATKRSDKAKRRAKRKQQAAPLTREQQVERIASQFAGWRGEPLTDDESDIISTIFDLQHNYLDERLSPRAWTPEDYLYVVTEVLPGKVLADDEYFASLGKLAGPFGRFLAERSREPWEPEALEAASRRLDDFARDVTDPAYRSGRHSMGARVSALAMEEGVDFTDPAAVQAFNERFNAMPYEWRKAATDPGPLAKPMVEFGDDTTAYDDAPEVSDEEVAQTIMQVVGLPDVQLDTPRFSRGSASALDLVAVRRAVSLWDWVATGPDGLRQATSTLAIRPRDLAEVLQAVGIEWDGPKPPSRMTQIPELALLWDLSLAMQLIEPTTRHRVGAIDLPELADMADVLAGRRPEGPRDQIAAATLVDSFIVTTFGSMVEQLARAAPSESDGQLLAEYAPTVLTQLLQTLSHHRELKTDLDPFVQSAPPVIYGLAAIVLTMIDELGMMGLLHRRKARHYEVDPAFGVALDILHDIELHRYLNELDSDPS